MISPTFATIILVSFLVVFGVILPVLNVKLPDYISYRWLCIVVVLAILIGAVIDFDGLEDFSRHVVLIGGLVIVGLYIFLRSWEKAKAKGWAIGTISVEKDGKKITGKYEDKQ